MTSFAWGSNREMISRVTGEPRPLARSQSARLLGGQAWELWAGERTVAVARAFFLAACTALFLHAAATIEVVYTLRISYILLGVACVVGFPIVLRGWSVLPTTWRLTAGLVVLSYVLAAGVGAADTVADQERGGSQREFVYLIDLLLGLATVGLISGLFPEGRGIRRAFGALLLGAFLAALYGIVQWPARHFDWPLANVNNALNPDAVTRGEVHQGKGLLLGWERVRGTFSEPLFFGLYLGAILPLALAWLRQSSHRLVACACVIALALFLTSSFPSWALFSLGSLIGLFVFALSRGRILRAALAGGTLALVGVGVALVLFGNPEIFAKATGREATELASTSASRTDAWAEAARTWERRPVFGHGPGQSGVQLARQQDPAVVNRRSAPVVLGSAQGLLPSALVDAGIVGAFAWIAFLTAFLAPILLGLVRRPTGPRLGVMVASLVAIGGGLVSGDRLEMQIWIVLGLGLALTTDSRRGPAGKGYGPSKHAKDQDTGRGFAESEDETFGQAKRNTMTTLESHFPGITEEYVRFAVVGNPDGVPARVRGEVDVRAWSEAAAAKQSRDRGLGRSSAGAE